MIINFLIKNNSTSEYFLYNYLVTNKQINDKKKNISNIQKRLKRPT